MKWEEMGVYYGGRRNQEVEVDFSLSSSTNSGIGECSKGNYKDSHSSHMFVGCLLFRFKATRNG